jgi:hypothetical protein
MKPKRKTASLSLRIAPVVKAAAERAAERDNRSVTSFIEVLIRDHCKAHDIPVEATDSRGKTT